MCNNNRILFSFLVIALSAVIAVNCISDTPPEAPIKATNSEAAAAPADPQPIAAQSPKQPAEHIIAKQGESVSGSELDKQIDSKSAAQEALKVDSEVAKRKARSESSPAASPAAESKPADKASPAAASPPKAAVAETKPAVKSAAASKPAPAASPAAPAAGAASSSSSSGAAAASGSKLAAKSKLPANLGTVTSTGSGGPAHYMSKHDAYSAIAEKHGALAQDAMRKSDKRQLQGGFGGIQKAGGLGDMFGPFKSVSDSGLARSKYLLISLFKLTRQPTFTNTDEFLLNTHIDFANLSSPGRLNEIHHEEQVLCSSLCCIGLVGRSRPDGLLRVAHITTTCSGPAGATSGTISARDAEHFTKHPSAVQDEPATV